MAASQLTVRLVQSDPRLGDLAANLATHRDAIGQAIADGVNLIIFPELSLTGYFLRDLVPDVALTLEAPELAELAELSREISIVAGFVEQDEQFSFFTSQGYFEAGGLRAVHRKVYLPTYGMFDEGRYLTPGRRLRSFDTRWGRVGLVVCEDLWHPSVPYVLSLDRMHYLIACACSPGRGVQTEELATAQTYEHILCAYAQLFQVYVLFCNRVGCEEGVCFWGGSRVLGPEGGVVAQAPELQEASLDAVLPPDALRRARMMAPLLDDENLDLTLRELERISRAQSAD